MAKRVDCLYHYCSLPKMANIIRSKQLWMSDISKSNDYEEMQLFIPNIYYEVEELYNKSQFPFKYKGLDGIKALRYIQRDVDN